ncbi:MAG: hypothetical protein J6Q85_01415 [Clostridia bacterium]|nr:hypothetical protein [Clostridia bacterium]
MYKGLKENLNSTKTLAILSVLSLVFGVLSIFVSELLVSLSSALFAAVIVFENQTKRFFSIATASVLFVINIAVFFFVGLLSLCALETVLLACIIAAAVKLGFRKSTTSALLTLAFTLLVGLTLLVYPMLLNMSFTLETAKEFYASMLESVRADFVDGVENMLASMSYPTEEYADLFTTEDIGMAFDSLVNSLVSIFVIIGFFVSGIALKAFCAVANAVGVSADSAKWRFETTSLFAYFYMALFLFSSFIMLDSDALSLTVLNLADIFMFVYAYVGCRVLFNLIRTKKSLTFTVIVFVLGFVLLSSMAIQVLSLIGASSTVFKNKIPPEVNTSQDSDNKNQ